MELVFRPATLADRDEAQRLLTAQLAEHGLPAEPERVRRGLECALAPHSPAWLWLAEGDGRPVAILLANELASVELGGLSLWVEELYVVPEARRRGIARTLLEHVILRARGRGLRAVELEVMPGHAAALALYAAMGFQELHRERLSLAI
jgi:GNAT superfamily N-acetyltransferase